MRLYFNGCSHTYGDDLADPHTQAWPAIVSKRLDCEFYNDGMSGSTNDRTLYRAIKHAHDYDKFYIAWSSVRRFTRYNPDNNEVVNFNAHLSHSKYENDKRYKVYGEYHYMYWSNLLFDFKLWLQNVILLQRFFVSLNKPYIMVNTVHNSIGKWVTSRELFNESIRDMVCFDNMNDANLDEEYNEIQLLVSQIDKRYFIGWGSWYIYKLLPDFPTGPTNHLLQDGHIAIADYILNNVPN